MKNWIEFSKLVKSRFLEISPNLWWGDNVDFRFWALSRTMIFKNKVILDLGCQAGIALSFLDKSNELYGVDIDESSIMNARMNVKNATFQCASMYNLPYQSKMFDVVIMLNVIPGWDFQTEYNQLDLDDDELRRLTFDEVSRVLKSNGTLIVTTPNGSSEYYKNQSKGKLSTLLGFLNGYEFKVYGWNNLLRHKLMVSPFIVNNLLKSFSWTRFVWRILLKNMNFDEKYSKSIGIIAKKKLVKKLNTAYEKENIS